MPSMSMYLGWNFLIDRHSTNIVALGEIVLDGEDQDVAFKILEQAKVPENWPIHLHCFNDGWKKCVKWMDIHLNLKFGSHL